MTDGLSKTPIDTVPVVAGWCAVVLALALAVPQTAVAEDFEVGAGHLSASVGEIVRGYGWTLVWAAQEDRLVEHPYMVSNGSLEDAITSILAMYRGQLVADLYEGNQVVVVDSPPPRMRVLMPGEVIDDSVAEGDELDDTDEDTLSTSAIGPLSEPNAVAVEPTEIDAPRSDQVVIANVSDGRRPETSPDAQAADGS